MPHSDETAVVLIIDETTNKPIHILFPDEDANAAVEGNWDERSAVTLTHGDLKRIDEKLRANVSG